MAESQKNSKWEISNKKQIMLEGTNALLAYEEISEQWKKHPIVTNNINYDKITKSFTGSHPFYIVALNDFFKKNRLPLSTLTIDDIQTISHTIDLEERYVDIALILRTAEDSYAENDYIAKDITKQLKKRKIHFSQNTPIMIQLKDLELIIDDKTLPWGIAFKLRENAEMMVSEQLNHKNHKRMFCELNERGMPLFDKNGYRQLWTRYDGLSRVSFLGANAMVLDSAGYSLWASGHRGKIIVTNTIYNERQK